jgi:hypothetical protein
MLVHVMNGMVNEIGPFSRNQMPLHMLLGILFNGKEKAEPRKNPQYPF